MSGISPNKSAVTELDKFIDLLSVHSLRDLQGLALLDALARPDQKESSKSAGLRKQILQTCEKLDLKWADVRDLATSELSRFAALMSTPEIKAYLKDAITLDDCPPQLKEYIKAQCKPLNLQWKDIEKLLKLPLQYKKNGHSAAIIFAFSQESPESGDTSIILHTLLKLVGVPVVVIDPHRNSRDKSIRPAEQTRLRDAGFSYTTTGNIQYPGKKIFVIFTGHHEPNGSTLMGPYRLVDTSISATAVAPKVAPPKVAPPKAAPQPAFIEWEIKTEVLPYLPRMVKEIDAIQLCICYGESVQRLFQALARVYAKVDGFFRATRDMPLKDIEILLRENAYFFSEKPPAPKLALGTSPSALALPQEAKDEAKTVQQGEVKKSALTAALMQIAAEKKAANAATNSSNTPTPASLAQSATAQPATQIQSTPPEQPASQASVSVIELPLLAQSMSPAEQAAKEPARAAKIIRKPAETKPAAMLRSSTSRHKSRISASEQKTKEYTPPSCFGWQTLLGIALAIIVSAILWKALTATSIAVVGGFWGMLGISLAIVLLFDIIKYALRMLMLFHASKTAEPSLEIIAKPDRAQAKTFTTPAAPRMSHQASSLTLGHPPARKAWSTKLQR